MLLHKVQEMYPFFHEKLFNEAKLIIHDQDRDNLDRSASVIYCAHFGFLHQIFGTPNMLKTGSWSDFLNDRFKQKLQERISDIMFCNQTFTKFMSNLDRFGEDTLVYLDPPYPDTHNLDSGKAGLLGTFTMADFEYMALWSATRQSTATLIATAGQRFPIASGVGAMTHQLARRHAGSNMGTSYGCNCQNIK